MGTTRLDSTYEGLKPEIDAGLAERAARLDSTYEGLKPGSGNSTRSNGTSLDSTYEGLKRSNSPRMHQSPKGVWTVPMRA